MSSNLCLKVSKLGFCSSPRFYIGTRACLVNSGTGIFGSDLMSFVQKSVFSLVLAKKALLEFFDFIYLLTCLNIFLSNFHQSLTNLYNILYYTNPKPAQSWLGLYFALQYLLLLHLEIWSSTDKAKIYHKIL